MVVVVELPPGPGGTRRSRGASLVLVVEASAFVVDVLDVVVEVGPSVVGAVLGGGPPNPGRTWA